MNGHYEALYADGGEMARTLVCSATALMAGQRQDRMAG
jgi:hypothetical protein